MFIFSVTIFNVVKAVNYLHKVAEMGAKSDNRWQVGDGRLFRHK